MDKLRELIEKKTGIPAILLTGDTDTENIELAKSILKYKRENQPRNVRQDLKKPYAAWLHALKGVRLQSKEEEALNKIEADYGLCSRNEEVTDQSDNRGETEAFREVAHQIFGCQREDM